MGKGKEARGGAFDITSVKSDNEGNGSWSPSTADKANETAIRGGEGTNMQNKGSVAGGDLSQSGVTNGYPSND